jgi:hypothetical protein
MPGTDLAQARSVYRPADSQKAIPPPKLSQTRSQDALNLVSGDCGHPL